MIFIKVRFSNWKSARGFIEFDVIVAIPESHDVLIEHDAAIRRHRREKILQSFNAAGRRAQTDVEEIFFGLFALSDRPHPPLMSGGQHKERLVID